MIYDMHLTIHQRAKKKFFFNLISFMYQKCKRYWNYVNQREILSKNKIFFEEEGKDTFLYRCKIIFYCWSTLSSIYIIFLKAKSHYLNVQMHFNIHLLLIVKGISLVSFILKLQQNFFILKTLKMNRMF